MRKWICRQQTPRIVRMVDLICLWGKTWRWVRLGVPALAALALMSGCAAPSPTTESLQNGYQDYQQGQYSSAENTARAFIAGDISGQNLAEAYYLAAISEEHQDELALAQRDYRAAIAHSQRRDLQGKSYKALGDISYVQARFNHAAADYKLSLSVDPSAPPDQRMLYRLGLSLENTGHWNDARQYLDELVARFPNSQLSKNALQRLAVNHFSLQFGAWNNAPAAWRQVAVLKSHGVGAIVVPHSIVGRTLFLVQGGSYSTYGAAMAARAAAAAQSPQVIVVP
jgi:tetratricopeptide (TPR) repeat protein